MLCKSLPEVMAYQNDKLVRLYCKRKNICQKQSLSLFNELKKLLWFLAQSDAKF